MLANIFSTIYIYLFFLYFSYLIFLANLSKSFKSENFILLSRINSRVIIDRSPLNSTHQTKKKISPQDHYEQLSSNTPQMSTVIAITIIRLIFIVLTSIAIYSYSKSIELFYHAREISTASIARNICVFP